MNKILALAAVFFVNLSVHAAPQSAEPVFSGEAAKIKSQLESLFEASKKVNASGAERKTARDRIESAMDWEQIAKDCLGNAEWKKATPAQRTSYRDLLKEVVVKTAFTRLDTFWDGAAFRFTKIEAKSGKAQASVTYTVKGDSFDLDYYLLKRGSDWAVYDIAFEEMRYSENIREQITAFLSGKGFASLLEKLKKRRDELDAPQSPPAKKS
jgi:ABC-type transporter MlaC component